MARNTPSARWKPKSRLLLPLPRPRKPALIFFLLLLSSFFSPILPADKLPVDKRPADPLIDQTVAVVGKQVILLKDVETEYALNTLLERRRLPARTEIRDDREKLEATRHNLVQKSLVRNYLDTTGLGSSLPPEREKAIQKQINASFSSEDAAKTQLKKEGYSESEVERYVQNRARYELFLEKYLSTRINLSEAEIRAFYEKEKDSRYLGKSFESVEKLVKAQLSLVKLKKEFEKWLETESRRTEIALLPLLLPEKK